MEQITFQGRWTPQNSHLQSNMTALFHSTHLRAWNKISLVVHQALENIARYLCPQGLQAMAKRAIVPSSEYSQIHLCQVRNDWVNRWEGADPQGDWIQMREAYEPMELQLQTPDNVTVNGIFYRHRRSAQRDRDIPTIICFNGNGGLAHSKAWDWLLKEGCSSSQPFNVLTYDYPTPILGRSNDLVVYGDMLVQAARDKLEISEGNLHFLGLSLGGAIGAKVAELNPLAGRVVNLKSFASMESVVLDPAGLFGSRAFVFRWILAKINAAIGWAIEASDALRKLKDKTLFIYTPQDQILPPSVTAVTAIAERSLPGDQVIALQLKPHIDVGEDYHNAPLCHFTDPAGNNVAHRIVNFLLGSSVFPSRNAPSLREGAFGMELAGSGSF